MFMFMYTCFEGGEHKELNPAQNKDLEDPASPWTSFMERTAEINDLLPLTVCVDIA